MYFLKFTIFLKSKDFNSLKPSSDIPLSLLHPCYPAERFFGGWKILVDAVWHKYGGSEGKLLLQRHDSRNISRPLGSVVRPVRLLRGNIAGRSSDTAEKIFLILSGGAGHTSARFPDPAEIFLSVEHTFAPRLERRNLSPTEQIYISAEK